MFWGLTFALVGFIILVVSVGGADLVQTLLAVTGVYSAIGIAYGVWAARRAVQSSRVG
jgi:hypothetical protein